MQTACEHYLRNEDLFQSSFDWRLKIFQYCFADVIRWQVYSIYYGENNPRKSSLKTDLGDAVVQFMLLVTSMGGNVEELFECGLDRLKERCYEQKAIKNLPQEIQNETLAISNNLINENLNRRYKWK